MSALKRHGPVRRDVKKGCCPPDGSAEPGASHLSGSAGRPVPTAAMTACGAARASPDPAVDDRWASLRASSRRLAELDTQQRHNNERVEMNKHEAALIAAKLKEVEDKVTRLEDLARRVLENARATSSAASSLGDAAELPEDLEQSVQPGTYGIQSFRQLDIFRRGHLPAACRLGSAGLRVGFWQRIGDEVAPARHGVDQPSSRNMRRAERAVMFAIS